MIITDLKGMDEFKSGVVIAKADVLAPNQRQDINCVNTDILLMKSLATFPTKMFLKNIRSLTRIWKKSSAFFGDIWRVNR